MFFRSKNKLSGIEDSELISRYRYSHETNYIGELYQRYTHLVFGVCLKYLKNEEEAKDSVMEIFEKVLVELKKHEVENFKSWLHSVTRNFCLMRLRKQKTVDKREEAYMKVVKDTVETEEELHLNGEVDIKELELQDLEEGLNSLKKEQKTCLELFYLQEKSYNEVAELTGYSLKQVKSYIQNGKRNLKNYLNENGERQREIL